MTVPRPRVDVDVSTLIGSSRIHGHHAKDLIVLHETVSGDSAGVGDITSPARFLAREGYGIHLLVDREGKSGWLGDPTAIVWHAASGTGNVNTRGIGIEQVSPIPLHPSPVRFREWWARRRQLNKVAAWCAWLCQTQGIPIRYSDGREPGITTHWDVSHTYHVAGGHWDCWPKHKHGYYPVLYVVQKARNIARAAEKRNR